MHCLVFQGKAFWITLRETLYRRKSEAPWRNFIFRGGSMSWTLLVQENLSTQAGLCHHDLEKHNPSNSSSIWPPQRTRNHKFLSDSIIMSPGFMSKYIIPARDLLSNIFNIPLIWGWEYWLWQVAVTTEVRGKLGAYSNTGRMHRIIYLLKSLPFSFFILFWWWNNSAGKNFSVNTS